MANAVNTGSTLTDASGANKTSTSLSTNIIIQVNGTPVGAVQSLQITEQRPLKMIDEVGTDGHIDSAPTGSTNISGSCNRIRFDRLRIAQAFRRGYVHVSAQMYPFDITLLDIQGATPVPGGLGDVVGRTESGNNSTIITVIKNVWIESISYTISANDWIIAEEMRWQAESIHSTINNGQSLAGVGERVVNPYLNIIEQQADTGGAGRRGALDTPGLINLINWSSNPY